MESKKTVTTIVKNQECTGCGTCNTACPFNAITMCFSSVGRLLPSIDENACRNCGVCLKVCPGIDAQQVATPQDINNPLLGHIKSLYSGRSTDKIIVENAQSGGLVTAVLKHLFTENLIDAALLVGQKDLKACYFVAKSVGDLGRSQLSQYTPVDLISGLKYVEAFERVAVVGLPCHIEGVKSLQKAFPHKYENIMYLLGLICAGTLSQSLVDIVKKRISGEIERIEWRSKSMSNYNAADIALYKTEEKSPVVLSRYLRLSSKPYLTAPRCKLCYDKMNVLADIVFGDSWGVKGADENGESVVLCRTEKGCQIIDAMIQQGEVSFRTCSKEEVIKGQGLKGKFESVGKAAAVYKINGWIVPKWTERFINSDSMDNSILESIINNYVSLDSLHHERVVETLYTKIINEYMKQKISSDIKSIIYRIYKLIKR